MRGHLGNYCLQFASKVRGSLLGLSPKPMGSSLIPVSIRIGLGHGAGIAENCPVWKKAHTSGVRNIVSVMVVGTQRRHTGGV